MTKDEARRFLKQYTKLGTIVLRKHCQDRMDERQVIMMDILYVLQWGEITELKWDEDYENWNCKITGNDSDGEALSFICGFNTQDPSVVCITVY